jgi:hypothetical protein
MLKYSGFMFSEIRRNGSPCTREQDRVVEMIRMFHKNEIALNRSAMVKHSYHLKYFVEHNFGPAVSGSSILGTASDLFGSWDQALWEAGLDPSEIRLRSRPGVSNLAMTPHQVEDIKRDGDAGLVTYLGNPSQTPEDILESKEASNFLGDALETLEENEKTLADRIFDAILQIHHYKDQDQLINFITQHLDKEVSLEEVKSILSKLATRLSDLNLTRL